MLGGLVLGVVLVEAFRGYYSMAAAALRIGEINVRNRVEISI